MSLPTLPTVEKLREALHDKAKRSSGFRFYTLYDKVCRKDVLWSAYRRCLVNRGAPGVDGQSFEDIEKYGEMRWLDELAEELRSRAYRPMPVRRVWIPKPNGKQRPLGIPTVRDRVVQMAAVLVLEPIFEADLQPEQYAYRPGRSAHDALKRIQALVREGHTEIVDADLSGYFDSIPHAELMKSVTRRVSDKSLLHLIRMWLLAPVEETDECGNTCRTTRNKDLGRGTPQGAPISPLLSNLYMRRFILGWKLLGHERCLDAHIVNYADDFVICCRRTADKAMSAMREMMQRLRLTINESKTRQCRVPEESFDFLGYTVGRLWSPRTGKAYVGLKPSAKKIQGLCQTISDMTSRRWVLLAPEDLVASLNRLLVGWANYFSLGTISRAYDCVDKHTWARLRQWLCRKHAVPGRGASRYPFEYLYGTLGLIQLRGRRRNLSCANP